MGLIKVDYVGSITVEEFLQKFIESHELLVQKGNNIFEDYDEFIASYKDRLKKHYDVKMYEFEFKYDSKVWRIRRTYKDFENLFYYMQKDLKIEIEKPVDEDPTFIGKELETLIRRILLD